MNRIPIFLADDDNDAALTAWRIADPATRERLIIFGAIGLITLLVLIWAVFLRKQLRRGHSHHHTHHHSSRPTEVPEVPKDEETPAPPKKRRRWRRPRRRHRPRNPTLAETGGLPPIRPESPPESQP